MGNMLGWGELRSLLVGGGGRLLLFCDAGLVDRFHVPACTSAHILKANGRLTHSFDGLTLECTLMYKL